MPTGNGWYLVGPLIAVGLVALLGAVFWRMGLQWTIAREPDPYVGLAVLSAGTDDYGLLGAAAVTDSPEVAEEIRQLLADAGIRATRAPGRDGRTMVLVFGEELEEARRLVGDSPAR
jgi:hypothetical protein